MKLVGGSKPTATRAIEWKSGSGAFQATNRLTRTVSGGLGNKNLNCPPRKRYGMYICCKCEL